MLHDMRKTSARIHQRLALIEPLVNRFRHPLLPFRYFRLNGPRDAPPVTPTADDDSWPTIPWLTHWGEADTNFVLRSWFQIPGNWPEEAPSALYLPIGTAGEFSHPEALVYIDGQPYAACDRHHQEILLPKELSAGTKHLIALHGWTGGRPGMSVDWDTRTGPVFPLLMHPCSVILIDQATRDLVALSRVALGVAEILNENNPALAHLYNALDAAFKVLDTRDPIEDHFYESVPSALEALATAIALSGPPLDVHITATGHAHIDMAWLWTLDQTRRKAGRTFHTMLRLLEQFPAFHFSQSQAQLYEFVRQDYPELFDAMKQKVDEGRWEPVGGMWVEADCNLSGGESLVRQLLLGKTFFRQHFGERGDSTVLWLPDVFGYAWNLPQLIRQAGMKYFFTIKIGWSEYNRLPYDSFWWQGLDGTRILTHFSPTKQPGSAFASTYNSVASPDEVLTTWTNFQQKDWGRPGMAPPLLMCYGHGDGGGGPTREMLENISLLGSFPAMPQVNFGTASAFFENLDAALGELLPTWNGELYLEYHRGTYTTQARNKRANRKSEFLLHDAEFLAALAATLDPSWAYPREALRQAWELVCLNQFHDILPGSSISEVYVESLRQYARVEEMGSSIQKSALRAISNHVEGELLVINPTSFPRQDLALWPEGTVSRQRHLQRDNGEPVLVQETQDGLLLDAGELPPYSVTSLYTTTSAALSAESPSPHLVVATPALLENEHLRVEFDSTGDIVRILDKENEREVLPDGAVANQLQAFEDRPRNWDAWDIDLAYADRTWLAKPAESLRVAEAGPLRATLEIRRRILNSEICQRVSLSRHSSRLDFATTIQWNERHTMLKVAFPVDILAPLATHEIQWGNVQRPTHRNTSWDWARFETCAHKWVDLSEGGYGVSLLNDCKYGHDIRDNVIRLTLLRSPADPDPEADLGEHQVTYSLLPHHGNWKEITVPEAYALNNPALVWERREPLIRAPQKHGSVSFLAVDCPNVVIETLKQAEDGNGLIVRLYECQRRRCEFILTCAFPLAGVWCTNILEEESKPLAVEGHNVRCPIKPYEIVTLRILPRPSTKSD